MLIPLMNINNKKVIFIQPMMVAPRLDLSIGQLMY